MFHTYTTNNVEIVPSGKDKILVAEYKNGNRVGFCVLEYNLTAFVAIDVEAIYIMVLVGESELTITHRNREASFINWVSTTIIY